MVVFPFSCFFWGLSVLVVVAAIVVVEVVALHDLHPFPAAYLQFFAPALAAEAESTALGNLGG